MSPKKIDLGATGETVRENIQRYREHFGLTFAEFSRRLEAIGNPIPPLGLRRIEAGERKVDVDDLLAISQVLGTSPVGLIMPLAESGDTPVQITGCEEAAARRVWSWLVRGSSLTSDRIDLDGMIRTLPQWRIEEDEKLNRRLLAEDFGISRDLWRSTTSED